MANYRPKSLNELGNLYDKSIEAQNEIKKSSSRLEDKPVQTATAFMPDEEALPMKKTPQQIASDEIANKIGDFAKTFGSEVTDTSKKPLAIATVQSKPRPKKKLESEDNSEVKAKKKAEPQKPRLIRNSERTDLFENYKKVMDDEDDYNFGEPEKAKRGILRKNKSVEKAAEEEKKEPEVNEIERQAEAAVGAVFQDVVSKKVEAPKEEKPQFKKVSYEDYIATRVEENEKTEEKEEEAKGEKNPLKQIILMVLLLCVLLSSIGIGCVKVFSGADSDKAVFGNHYVYTAKRNYSDLDVRKGSLVITRDEYPAAGDIVAYRQDSGAYAFARFETVLNVESAIANDGAQQILIFNKDLRGVVTTAIPVVGIIVSAIMTYFLPIMGLMLLIVALLILLIYFVSKDDDGYYEDEQEEYEEEYDEEDYQAETQEDEEMPEQKRDAENDDADKEESLEELFTLG